MKKFTWLTLILCVSCTTPKDIEPPGVLTVELVGMMADTSDVPIEGPEAESKARLRALKPIAKHPVPARSIRVEYGRDTSSQ